MWYASSCPCNARSGYSSNLQYDTPGSVDYGADGDFACCETCPWSGGYKTGGYTQLKKWYNGKHEFVNCDIYYCY
jgi:hypothetical protein